MTPHRPRDQANMSLSFLAKKTWNPTNLKNVEKVWIAEQKADAEAKKLQELKKQIAEERQLQVGVCQPPSQQHQSDDVYQIS